MDAYTVKIAQLEARIAALETQLRAEVIRANALQEENWKLAHDRGRHWEQVLRIKKGEDAA